LIGRYLKSADPVCIVVFSIPHSVRLPPMQNTVPWLAVLLVSVGSFTGCGDAGPSTLVSGKVTTGGAGVTGTIHFVGADGKEVSAPVGPTGGTYQIANPPLGEVTVLVKGGPVAAPPLKPAPGAVAMPGNTSTPAAAGAQPPAKYADPSTSDLKYTVVAGAQQKDFDLAP
jgi:hypothetical protein